MKGATRTIEVFRPGTFTPMTGEPVTFSAADLVALAASYDAATAPAPAVIGHPKTDDPAFGWAQSFSFDEGGQRLVAEVGEIEPAFAEAVAAGRYKRISLSLYPPAAANNPKPGQWYPKHIGFLGAAAPAVSGLKPVAFAAADGALTFEFADATALRDVAGLFRSMRDFFIEKFGLEAADKAMPSWSISWIDDAADRPARDDVPGLGFSEANPNTTTEPIMDPTKAAADAAALAAREASVLARERAAAHTENVAFAEALVSDRRLLPALKDKVVGLLDGLAPSVAPEVSFADGTETRTLSASQCIRDILAAQPQLAFGAVELEAETATVSFAMPEGCVADPTSAALHARALAHQAAHPGTDYMAAVAAVNR